jgi:hypothetical protein
MGTVLWYPAIYVYVGPTPNANLKNDRIGHAPATHLP